MAAQSQVTASRRLWAVGALFAVAAVALFLGIALIRRWDVLVASLLSLSVTVVAGWYVLSRRGVQRAVAAGLAVLGLVLVVWVLVRSHSVWVLAVALALAAVSVASAGAALRPGKAAVGIDSAPAPTARHPVLLMNLKSGGGKAERFQLTDLCRQRGIEPVILTPGSDLLQLAEDVVARGADLIGMAGGDGSQALVASVASRHGVPHVVVPAGTRNHFALDLGLDRDDVVGALAAYEDGVDRVVDLAEVNGRIFVNNASMGVYATIVQSSEYRDAKVRTTAALLPDVIGPDATPLDLRFSSPEGEEAPTAELILVSNNPYELHHLRGAGTRKRIDRGVLGIVALHVRGAKDAEALATLEAAGQVHRFSGWQEWTAPAFEVRSQGRVQIGVDGEALALEPPLRFRIRPAALTVRLPRTAVGLSPAARAVRIASRTTVQQLYRVAVGKEP